MLGLTGEDDADRGRRRALIKRGVGCVAATCGERGAVIVDAAETVQVPAFATDVVDTTGCGDAFSAGFLRGSPLGRSRREAAVLGCAAAALVAQGLGSDHGDFDLAAADAFAAGDPNAWTLKGHRDDTINRTTSPAGASSPERSPRAWRPRCRSMRRRRPRPKPGAAGRPRAPAGRRRRRRSWDWPVSTRRGRSAPRGTLGDRARGSRPRRRPLPEPLAGDGRERRGEHGRNLRRARPSTGSSALMSRARDREVPHLRHRQPALVRGRQRHAVHRARSHRQRSAGRVQLGTVTLPSIDSMASTLPLDAPYNAPRAVEWDSMTVETWGQQNILSAEGARAVRAGGRSRPVGRAAGRLDAVLPLLRRTPPAASTPLVANAGAGGAQDYRVSGGTQRIADRHGRGSSGIGSLLSRPVREIAQGAQRRDGPRRRAERQRQAGDRRHPTQPRRTDRLLAGRPGATRPAHPAHADRLADQDDRGLRPAVLARSWPQRAGQQRSRTRSR